MEITSGNKMTIPTSKHWNPITNPANNIAQGSFFTPKNRIKKSATCMPAPESDIIFPKIVPS